MRELYQTFRYMFANWLTENHTIRKDIEEILFSVHKWPTYEQRKRLEILLTTKLQSWIYADTEKWDMPAGFLRKNCRVLDEGDCTGACVWKEEDGKGACLLHTNHMTTIGTHGGKKYEVATQDVFSRRLIDELISFPHRRKELLSDSVSRIQTLLEPVRIGNQYIIPERGASWFDILKLDWMTKIMETPRYYEEMSTGAKGKVKGMASPLPSVISRRIGKSSYKVWWINEPEELSTLLKVPLTSPFALQDAAKAQEVATQKGETIGVLDTASDSIQFYIAMKRDPVSIVVYDRQKVGFLIETEGSILLSIAKFTKPLKEALAKVIRDTLPTAPKRARKGLDTKSKVEVPPTEEAVAEEVTEAPKAE
jgi:hypothetical protein